MDLNIKMNATLVTGSPVTHFMLSYTSTLVTTSAILFSDTVKYVEHTAICGFSDNLSLGEKEFLKKKDYHMPHNRCRFTPVFVRLWEQIVCFTWPMS